MHVELDLFSGRPNPSWSLPPDQTEALRHMLDGLPDAAGPLPALFDGLGYRGFRVSDPGRKAVYFVRGGIILVEERGARSAKADTLRQLERALLETARPHLGPELFRLVQDRPVDTAGN